jgi:hypothetical protein
MPTWSKGPAFDLAILKHALGYCGLSTPWEFWHERDVRTIESLFPKQAFPHLYEDDFELPPHSALGDALRQAKRMQAMLVTLDVTV